jgi:hypothetical protein
MSPCSDAGRLPDGDRLGRIEEDFSVGSLGGGTFQ